MQVFNVKSLLLPYCLGRCDLASHLPSKLPLIPSLIFLPFLQLIIQLLGGMIIGIGICKPLIKGAVVVHLRFLLSERLHHAPLFYFRKHQVHAGGKGRLVLILLHHVERIFHQTPHNVPVLLLRDGAL